MALETPRYAFRASRRFGALALVAVLSFGACDSVEQRNETDGGARDDTNTRDQASTELDIGIGTTLDVGAPSFDSPTFEACTARILTPQMRTADYVIVVNSASPDSNSAEDAGPSRWGAIARAVTSFVGRIPSSSRVAMFLYPRFETKADGGTAEACDATAFDAPDISFDAADGGADRRALIEATLAARVPRGGNTLTSALGGALNYAKKARLAGSPVVNTLLVSDAAPDPCGATVADAAQLTRDPHNSQSVDTYVLSLEANPVALDPIASAGGTARAEAAFDDDDIDGALQDLEAWIGRCRFHLPPLASDERLRMDAVFDVGTPAATWLSRFANGSRCPDQPGWFLDDDASPTDVVLCPASCDALRASPARMFNVTIGCWTSAP